MTAQLAAFPARRRVLLRANELSLALKQSYRVLIVHVENGVMQSGCVVNRWACNGVGAYVDKETSSALEGVDKETSFALEGVDKDTSSALEGVDKETSSAMESV